MTALGDDGFRLETADGAQHEARTVIVAAGVGAFGPNCPPLDGIEHFEGKSVFYLVKRREDFRGKRIVIAGGGDSAVDWALSLPEVAASVMLVHRRDKFRAAPESLSRLKRLSDSGKLEFVVPYQLHSLEGDKGALRAVIVADLDGNRRRLEADCLLPFFGLSMNLGPIAEWGLALDHHHIEVDPATCATSCPVSSPSATSRLSRQLKLIVTGFAEAAQAARAIHSLARPGAPLHFEYSTMTGVPGRN